MHALLAVADFGREVQVHIRLGFDGVAVYCGRLEAADAAGLALANAHYRDFDKPIGTIFLPWSSVLYVTSAPTPEE